VEIFAEKNSKIASLTSCQRSDLRKTLTYRENWNPRLIFEYPNTQYYTNSLIIKHQETITLILKYVKSFWCHCWSTNIYIYSFLYNWSSLWDSDLLEIAKVVPIYKNGERNLPGNYRPISLLSIFDKILEKLMHKRLYDFLETSKFFMNTSLGLGKIIPRHKQSWKYWTIFTSTVIVKKLPREYTWICKKRLIQLITQFSLKNLKFTGLEEQYYNGL